MAAEGFGYVRLHLFPSLGPALMISMGYIDLGKWVAAVEGGAQFGFNLGLLVLLNLSAILCQYLASCIGMVTGKNLAEICSKEYCKLACVALGVQAELSMIISELTMILGMAHGLNLLLGVDLFICIFFVTAGSLSLPLIVKLLDNRKVEALYIGMAGFALLFYVLGVLFSQPEVPLVMSGIFPKMTGENVYSLMALLGANIMAHNFYIHSSIVQQQRRSSNVVTGALFHDHFFAILFIFTGIFLVNYVLINSAAAVFGSGDVVVLNFHDISLLMDQIFRSPIAPVAFFLVLFVSSQITTLTWNIGGQVIMRHFFGMDVSVWVHHVCFKALCIIPAFYCAKSADFEGIYQLLIFSQVIIALLLPSSVIPLFRVATSRIIMGSFKFSWYLEILALFVFLGMLAASIIFTMEMLVGNSSWATNLMGGMGSSLIMPYAILLIACASLGFTLYLAVTPLKSVSNEPNTQTWSLSSLEGRHQELFESRGEEGIDTIEYEESQGFTVETTFDKSMEIKSDSSVLEFNLNLADSVSENDHGSCQSAADTELTFACSSPSYQIEETKALYEMEVAENLDTVFSGVMSDQGILDGVEKKDLNDKDVEVEVFVSKDKDGESLGDVLPVPTSEIPEPSSSVKGKDSDSKLSGLGRAARRQLAAILDEFWGNLFDFHGKLTQEATTKRFDVLLGLDPQIVGSSVKAESTAVEPSKNLYTDSDRGLYFPVNSRDHNSPRKMKNPNFDLSHGVQMETPSWSKTMQPNTPQMETPSWSKTMQPNTLLQSSSNNLIDPSERLYSSLRLQQHYDNHDYQPATIHGYQIASYLKGIDEPRNPYLSSMSSCPPQAPNSAASFLPSLRDQVMYARGQSDLSSSGTSGMQRPHTPAISESQVERHYYEPSVLGHSESNLPSAYTKKYHSSPDISTLIANSRNLYMNEGKMAGPIGPRQSLGRMAYDQSQYLNNVSRTGVPLAFNELSPPKLHRDVFSLQSSMNMNTKSLWSTQPFEQLFGVMGKDQNDGNRGVTHGHSIAPKATFSYADSEAKLLQSFRFCIMKLLKLEGSDWLFKQNGGFDEELIDQVAAAERYLQELNASGMNPAFMGEHQHLTSARKSSSIPSVIIPEASSFLPLPNCGDNCIWRAALVVSFGVWCIRRILEMALVESRPELWGKYTYDLNRLQGIIEPAFSKPRHPITLCTCLEIPSMDTTNPPLSNRFPFPTSTGKGIQNSLTTASVVLDIIKDVENSVSGRKGRTGTAAGDVAFPKGKENLASVLKRYKRRLTNKSPGTGEGIGSSRRISTSTLL